MPLQNRVTPFSTIIATPERGMFMGNRGCLHNSERTLVRQTCGEIRWIICQIAFKGRQRTLMAPGRYTELFFLDEATALAAGHRPCSECRRSDYLSFRQAWIAGNPDAALTARSSITEIDRRLQSERRTEAGEQQTYRAKLSDLPGGTMVVPDGSQSAHLWASQNLRLWTPAGYAAARTVSGGDEATVLTPLSIVRAIACGFAPVIHASE